MYVALFRLIIVILGICLFFKYLFCIELEMLADDPNNTDETNEELNKTRRLNNLNSPFLALSFYLLFLLIRLYCLFLNRCLNNDPYNCGVVFLCVNKKEGRLPL